VICQREVEEEGKKIGGKRLNFYLFIRMNLVFVDRSKRKGERAPDRWGLCVRGRIKSGE
jgi:hypothetical protein